MQISLCLDFWQGWNESDSTLSHLLWNFAVDIFNAFNRSVRSCLKLDDARFSDGLTLLSALLFVLDLLHNSINLLIFDSLVFIFRLTPIDLVFVKLFVALVLASRLARIRNLLELSYRR